MGLTFKELRSRKASVLCQDGLSTGDLNRVPGTQGEKLVTQGTGEDVTYIGANLMTL